MGPTVINGLPAHVLLVHVVVVFVPLAAILLVLSALWPAARRRLGIVTPIVALIALAIIPPTTNAGDWLAARVGPSPDLAQHISLADGLLPTEIAVFVVAAALWVLFAKPQWLLGGGQPRGAEEKELVSSTVGAGATESAADRPAAESTVMATPTVIPIWLRATRIVAIVLAVVVSVGSVVDVVLIGDAGAKSAWNGSFSMTPKN
jgi:hypothetical protein